MRTLHKRSILSLLASLGLAMPAAAGVADEASLEILVDTIQANKKAFVAVNLGLEDDEAEAFWPLYDRYQGDLSSVRDRFVEIIEDYTTNFTTMNDEYANRLLEEFLEIELERAEVRKKYKEPFSKILPGRKVVRFYQIENKIQAVLRYELARDIPVIEQ